LFGTVEMFITSIDARLLPAHVIVQPSSEGNHIVHALSGFHPWLGESFELVVNPGKRLLDAGTKLVGGLVECALGCCLGLLDRRDEHRVRKDLGASAEVLVAEKTAALNVWLFHNFGAHIGNVPFLGLVWVTGPYRKFFEKRLLVQLEEGVVINLRRVASPDFANHATIAHEHVLSAVAVELE
jgi:hypothetical protein